MKKFTPFFFLCFFSGSYLFSQSFYVYGPDASEFPVLNAGFIDSMSGALLVAERARNKKVIVFLTDGESHENELQIIDKALEIEAVVYCVTLDQKCPEILKSIAIETRGEWFEKVTSEQEAELIFLKILKESQGGEACDISWESISLCLMGAVKRQGCIIMCGRLVVVC